MYCQALLASAFFACASRSRTGELPSEGIQTDSSAVACACGLAIATLTFYFRTHFEFTNAGGSVTLTATNAVDRTASKRFYILKGK